MPSNAAIDYSFVGPGPATAPAGASNAGGASGSGSSGTAMAIAVSLAFGALGCWSNGVDPGTSSSTNNQPANWYAGYGFPDGQLATVKATATTTGTCSLVVFVPVGEIPVKGTRVLQIFYRTTAPTAAVETMTATVSHPGGTGNGTVLPQGDYSVNPYTMPLTTIGSALSVTFQHSGTAAATSTGSWLVDTVGVVVADYFAGQAADTGLFVKAGRTFLLDVLRGNAGLYTTQIANMCAGNGTAAVTDADTKLVGSTVVNQGLDAGGPGQQAAPSRSGQVATINSTVPPGPAFTLAEASLVCGYANGSPSYPMACRVVMAKPFAKTANQSVAFTWTLTGA